jgi:hypothetical protein
MREVEDCFLGREGKMLTNEQINLVHVFGTATAQAVIHAGHALAEERGVDLADRRRHNLYLAELKKIHKRRAIDLWETLARTGPNETWQREFLAAYAVDVAVEALHQYYRRESAT